VERLDPDDRPVLREPEEREDPDERDERDPDDRPLLRLEDDRLPPLFAEEPLRPPPRLPPPGSASSSAAGQVTATMVRRTS